MDVVEVEFVVPAGDCQVEEVVEELEDVGYGVGLDEGVLALLLKDVEVVRFLFLDDVYDYLLEVVVESADVYFAELLLGLVDLLVLDYVLVDQALVGREGLEDVQNIDALDLDMGGVPDQLQVELHFLLHDLHEADQRPPHLLLVRVDLTLQHRHDLVDEGVQVVSVLLDDPRLELVLLRHQGTDHLLDLVVELVQIGIMQQNQTVVVLPAHVVAALDCILASSF